MAQVAFDTLKFVDTLKNAGVPENQARAFSVAVKESHEAADVATRSDITLVKNDISLVKKDIAALRAENKADIELVKKDIAALRAENKTDIELVKKDIAALRAETKADAESLRSDLNKLELKITVKLGAMLAVTVGVLTAILKF